MLANAIEYFRLLKYGLAIVLVFIGGKMLAEKWVHISTNLSLAIVAGIIVISILLSVFITRETPARPNMKYRWTIAPSQPALAEFLAGQLKISPLLAQCLLNRGFSEPEPIARFLEPRLKNLADPFLLPNMQAAVDRLFAAHAAREPLVIFGDYDVDGVTSTTLLYEFLTALGWKVHCYLPHRMDEGYGLSQSGVENCLQKFPVKLLLAVDCGSTARDQIAWLRERGVDVLVLDHHQVSDPPPAAVALVNPQLQRAASIPPTSPHSPNFAPSASLSNSPTHY